MGCHALLQGIFPTQRLNLLLLPLMYGDKFFTSELLGKLQSIPYCFQFSPADHSPLLLFPLPRMQFLCFVTALIFILQCGLLHYLMYYYNFFYLPIFFSRQLAPPGRNCEILAPMYKDHGIRSHHFMGKKWGNSGNSVRLYFSGLQNHYRW